MGREIHPTAIVSPDAELGEDVTIGPYVVIRGKVKIGDRTVIGSHTCIDGTTTIGSDNKIGRHACIGADPQDLKYRGEETFLEIGNNNAFGDFVQFSRGTHKSADRTTKIGNNNYIMAYAHVGHDCIVSDYCVLANAVQLAGHVELEDHVHMGGLAGVHQFCVVGRFCMIGGVTPIAGHLPPYVRAAGGRSTVSGLNSVGLKRSGEFDGADMGVLKAIYKSFFRGTESLETVLDQIDRNFGENRHALHFKDFINRVRQGTAAGRPICRE